MKILAIDSSAKPVSVAVSEDQNLLGEFFINNGLTHSQTLAPMVADILKVLKININEIDLFAVSLGPGSFTGLRIGIATIKGLAFANNTPCIGVSTLNSIAYNFWGENKTVCVVMDAKCDNVYTAIFEISESKITRITQDRLMSIEDLYSEVEKLEKEVILVGDGAVLCYNKNKKKLKVRLALENKQNQRASSVALAAYASYSNRDAVICPSELKPVYLRKSQAERNLIVDSKKGILL